MKSHEHDTSFLDDIRLHELLLRKHKKQFEHGLYKIIIRILYLFSPYTDSLSCSTQVMLSK
jgi:hypothetical protein